MLDKLRASIANKTKIFKPKFPLSTNFKWKYNRHIRILPSPQVEGILGDIEPENISEKLACFCFQRLGYQMHGENQLKKQTKTKIFYWILESNIAQINSQSK